MYTNNEQASSEGELTVREKIQYSLLGVLVLGGAVILGRTIVKKATYNNEQRKTYTEGNTATYAKQIKMAFDNDGWWGTDKDILRQVVRVIPSKGEFRKVMTSYQKLYGRNLLADMQGELKTTEYNEILAIISTKPEHGEETVNEVTAEKLQSWAKRARAAFEISYGPFPGTDEPAIRAVFLEIPTQEAYRKMAAVYQSMYGNSFTDDLKSELELWEYAPMMQLISGKPKN
ncbi:MAG: annexin [Pedobacter sp.]|nr:annexin [Pedobacter sp.]